MTVHPSGVVPGSTIPLYDRFSLLLAVLLTGLVAVLFRDYGYSWDEVAQNRWYGQAVLKFISSFGRDTTAVTEFNYYLYGGSFDALAEWFVSLSWFDARNARHLANALLGLTGVAGCWRLTRHLGSSRAGFWAILMLVCCAPYFGHMFINAKDIPFAAGYVWSLYLLVRLVEDLPFPSLRRSLLLGVVLGLTLGVRIGGVLILFYLCLMIMTRTLSDLRKLAVGWFSPGELLRRLSPVCISLPVAWVIMLPAWPAALLSPVQVPLAALAATRHFNWNRPMFWRGEVIYPDHLPWDYLPVIYGVQLPEVLVLLLPAAVGWGLFHCLRRGQKSKPVAGLALLLQAALFPPFWAIVSHATIYDNGRQFLFVLLPLVSLGALFWERLLVRLGTSHRGPGLLLAGLLLAGLALTAFRMCHLHPYEYAFFNRWSGGMPVAAASFETDYWITSYHEAAVRLREHASRQVPDGQLTVAVVGPAETVRESLPERFSLETYDSGAPADYLIATTRWNADQLQPEWPIVDTVGRLGMVFAVVKCRPPLLPGEGVRGH